MKLLSDDFPAAYRRAAAFSISRMLANKPARQQNLAYPIVLSYLHQPLTGITDEKALTASKSVSVLTNIIVNADPSPNLISVLISPVISPLYALLFQLDSVKTSDPTLKESVRGLLSTWARVVAVPEGIAKLWSILDDGEIEWQINLEGQVKRVAKLVLCVLMDLSR